MKIGDHVVIEQNTIIRNDDDMNDDTDYDDDEKEEHSFNDDDSIKYLDDTEQSDDPIDKGNTALPLPFAQQQSLTKAGFSALKQNLIPGLILQSFGVFIVILYFSSDSVKSAMDSIADLKDRSGFAFSAISTALFAGVLPCLIQEFQHRCTFVFGNYWKKSVCLCVCD
jgi:hypothetical protein